MIITSYQWPTEVMTMITSPTNFSLILLSHRSQKLTAKNARKLYIDLVSRMNKTGPKVADNSNSNRVKRACPKVFSNAQKMIRRLGMDQKTRLSL